jgi:hypothetical protein
MVAHDRPNRPRRPRGQWIALALAIAVNLVFLRDPDVLGIVDQPQAGSSDRGAHAPAP